MLGITFDRQSSAKIEWATIVISSHAAAVRTLLTRASISLPHSVVKDCRVILRPIHEKPQPDSSDGGRDNVSLERDRFLSEIEDLRSLMRQE